MPRLVGHVHLSGHELHVDAVRLGKGEHVFLGVLGQIEESLGALVAEFGLQFLRIPALAGAHLPAIAAGRAVADAAALDHDDRQA
ncbi:hypothetical protein D3C72_2348340 [compost metagenome]